VQVEWVKMDGPNNIGAV